MESVDVEGLRARLKAAATARPWRISLASTEEFTWIEVPGSKPGMPVAGLDYREDADLAVAAVNALPGLLDRIEALVGALRDCEEYLVPEPGDDAALLLLTVQAAITGQEPTP